MKKGNPKKPEDKISRTKFHYVRSYYGKELLQQRGRLDYFFWVNERYAEGGSKLDRIRKSEQVKGAFSVELFSFDCIDVRENQIHCLLRKTVEGSSRWNDIAKQGMVLFDMRFFIGRVWFAKENSGFP